MTPALSIQLDEWELGGARMCVCQSVWLVLRITPRGRRQPKFWELLCKLVVFSL